MGDQTRARLSRAGPLWPLVLLSLDLTGGSFSCSIREKGIRGVRPPVPKLWSLAPSTPGRQSREALGTPLGNEYRMDLSDSPCLKATSSQSDKRAARGRGCRKAWSGGEGAARAQCQHSGGRAALLKWTVWLFPETRVNLGKSRRGGCVGGPAGAEELE